MEKGNEETIIKKKRRIKKRYIILLFLILLITTSMYFLSDFARNYIVKNSEKMIGRKIALKELHINYWKCSFDLKDFVLYEKSTPDTFVAFKEFYIDFDPMKLLSKEYTFSEIKLVQPTVNISYNGKIFNFDDLTKLGDSTKKDSVKKKTDEAVKYVLKNIHLDGGNIHYTDVENNSKLDMKDMGINLPFISWDSKQANMGVDFMLGETGEVNLKAEVNQAARKYNLHLKLNNIDLAPLKNYFVKYSKDYMLISDVSGKFYSDVNIVGDMDHPMNVQVSGESSIKGCKVKDLNGKIFLQADNAKAVFDTLDMSKFSFKLAKVELTAPQLVIILDNDKSNLEKIFAPFMAPPKVVANAVTKPSDTTQVFYLIKDFIVNNAKISFTDHTIERPFYYDLLDINVTMKNIYPTATDIPINFDMNLNKSGTFKGVYSLNMMNPKVLTFDGKIDKMGLTSFSPYSEHFLARPITKGLFNYRCKLKMTPNKLENKNLIRVDKMEVGKKNGKPLVKAPVSLALYILKDKNDVISIDLPVDGKPSDPNFKLSKIIWTTLENFLVKIALSPFKAIGGLFSTNPEEIKEVPFQFLQDSLDAKQTKTLDLLAEVHQKKPDFVYVFTQKTDVSKEKEELAIHEVKSRFLSINNIDTLHTLDFKIASLNEKDSSFLSYIKTNSQGLDSLPLGKKCIQIIGSPSLDVMFNSLLQKREKLLGEYLCLKKNIPRENVLVKTADFRDLTEEVKVPKFDVELTLK